MAVALVLSMIAPGVVTVLAVPVAVAVSILTQRRPTGHQDKDVAERLLAAAVAFAGERTSPDGEPVDWGAALRAELATMTVPRERRRFAVGAAVALLGRPHPRRSFVIAVGVAVAFGAGVLGVSRAGLGEDGLGSVTMLLPPVLLFAVGYRCARSTRSLRFGLETGILAAVTTLVAVAVVYGVEAAHWYHLGPRCQRPGRRPRRLRLDPGSRPGRGASGHPARPPPVLVALASLERRRRSANPAATG